MKRVGKIARLPYTIRDEVGRRILDGQTLFHIADWLNTLPIVRAVLGRHFGGKPIRSQNLSEWKQYGYKDWQIEYLAEKALEQAVAAVPAFNQLPDVKQRQQILEQMRTYTRKYLDENWLEPVPRKVNQGIIPKSNVDSGCHPLKVGMAEDGLLIEALAKADATSKVKQAMQVESRWDALRELYGLPKKDQAEPSKN